MTRGAALRGNSGSIENDKIPGLKPGRRKEEYTILFLIWSGSPIPQSLTARSLGELKERERRLSLLSPHHVAEDLPAGF